MTYLILAITWLAAIACLWLDYRLEVRRRRQHYRVRDRRDHVDIVYTAVIVKGEQYVFLGEDTPENRQGIVNVATRFAADSRLNFSATAAAKVADAMQKKEQSKVRARTDFKRDMI